MKITNYMVVDTRFIDDLQICVANLIKEGWEPFGILAIDSSDKVVEVFFQPMVRRDPPQ